MMLQSPSYPRRSPAHLSVSMRHERPAVGNATATTSQAQQTVKGKKGPPQAELIRQSSDDSSDSEGSAEPNLQRWFDRSNRRPERGFSHPLEDSELLPPMAAGQAINCIRR